MKQRKTEPSRRKLFGPRDDWHHNACVNYQHDSLHAYTRGYLTGAKALVDQVRKDRSKLDTMIFAIVFLYRHYIELKLKFIIREGNQLLDRPAVDLLRYGHKIGKLWSDSRRIIEAVFEDEDRAPLDRVTEIIEEFERDDPYATGFKYPEDTKRNRSLSELRHINVAQFSEAMDEVEALIEGAAEGVAYYLDMKRDSESEFREDHQSW